MAGVLIFPSHWPSLFFFPPPLLLPTLLRPCSSPLTPFFHQRCPGASTWQSLMISLTAKSNLQEDLSFSIQLKPWHLIKQINNNNNKPSLRQRIHPGAPTTKGCHLKRWCQSRTKRPVSGCACDPPLPEDRLLSTEVQVSLGDNILQQEGGWLCSSYPSLTPLISKTKVMAGLTPWAMLNTPPDTSYFRQPCWFVQKPGIAPMGACYAHFNEYLNSTAITSEKCTEFFLTSLGSDFLSASSLPGRFRSISSGNMNGWWSQSPCRSLSSSPSPISLCPISF